MAEEESPPPAPESTPAPGAPPPAYSDAEMAAFPAILARKVVPDELKAQLDELERWATANREDARRDAIAFWALKAPAILSAASSGLWAYLELMTIAVIAGSIASICVLVDGIHPRGMLRNTHVRAFHDIRILSSNMMSAWRSRDVNEDDNLAGRRIILDAEAERQRIAVYVRDAESSLKFKDAS